MNVLSHNLTDKLKQELKEYSISGKPEEVCGLFLKNVNNISFYKCKNISYHKKEHCILNPLDYVKASKLGKIIAHFHSQDEKFPSLLDSINAFNHNIYSIIYSWKYDVFSILEPKLKEYLGLEYSSGENDCYSLVRNYFKNELNIELKDYNRKGKWWEYDPTMILDNFSEEGGIPISYGDIKKNDVIVFNLDGVVCHFAIYLGGDFVLHHPYNDISVISELTENYKKRIAMVIRHKDLF